MNGYVVVRKPAHCPKYGKPPLRLCDNGTIYAGVDRCEWDECADKPMIIDLELYKDTEVGPCGINVIADLALVRILYDPSVHDVLWVSAEIDPARLDRFLGVDLVTGYGSAIVQGIFKAPDLFQSFLEEINDFGLFEINMVTVSEYCSHYLMMQALDRRLERFGALSVADAVYVYSVEVSP